MPPPTIRPPNQRAYATVATAAANRALIGRLALIGMTAGRMGLVDPIWPAVAIALAGSWLGSATTWTARLYRMAGVVSILELGSSVVRIGFQRHRDLIATVRQCPRWGIKQRLE
ncbi:hypothetical protein BC360_24965 [Ensifer sp. LC163]|nr:hypothetical protein BC360_24965 [Ensifer sp. LC163]